MLYNTIINITKYKLILKVNFAGSAIFPKVIKHYLLKILLSVQLVKTITLKYQSVNLCINSVE